MSLGSISVVFVVISTSVGDSFDHCFRDADSVWRCVDVCCFISFAVFHISQEKRKKRVWMKDVHAENLS